MKKVMANLYFFAEEWFKQHETEKSLKMQNMFKQDLEESWMRSGGTSSKQGGKTETRSFEDII